MAELRFNDKITTGEGTLQWLLTPEQLGFLA
jgi:hypothetical protein